MSVNERRRVGQVLCARGIVGFVVVPDAGEVRLAQGFEARRIERKIVHPLRPAQLHRSGWNSASISGVHLLIIVELRLRFVQEAESKVEPERHCSDISTRNSHDDIISGIFIKRLESELQSNWIQAATKNQFEYFKLIFYTSYSHGLISSCFV